MAETRTSTPAPAGRGRRGFFAFLGGASVTGLATTRASVAKPTLILPPEFTASVPSVVANTVELDAVHAVKAGLPHAMFLDWLEGGLRMVEDCKPGGGVFGAFWRDAAAGRIPEPPKRHVGSGGRTPHEQAYLMQNIDNLKASIERKIAWSKALPIRQGGAS